MSQQKYAKLSPGIGYDIVMAHDQKRTEIHKQVSAICEEVGGIKDRYMSRGTIVEGFAIGLKGVPVGWRRDGQTSTYMVPDKKLKSGKEYAKRLKNITLLTQEDLANELGFPPFFNDYMGGFCTAVGYIIHQGSVYVSYPAVLSLKHQHEPVTHEEWERVWAEKKSKENNKGLA